MCWLALILILVVFFYEQITLQSVLKLICFYVKNLTPKFKSTGQAILYTILIDRPAVYSARASGL